MNWYLKVLKQYADFNGRARHQEYWMFVLINAAISFGATLIGGLLGVGTLLQLVYSFAVLVPTIAVGVRRLHDIGKSGWMLLVSFIPIAGIIWILVLLAKEGEVQPNQWGDNPKLGNVLNEL